MAGEFDFTRFAVGGAQRPDSFSGLSPQFRSSLAQLFQAAPPEIQQVLRITSGYRSPQRQTELWNQALAKYGSPSAARKWVAPPGRSKHNHGEAVDLKYLSPAATKWVHANAQNFGLHFPLSNENWHIEPLGSRGGHNHTAVASAAPVPVARPSAPPAMQPGPTGMPQPPQSLAALVAPGVGPMPMAPIDPLTGPVQAPQGFGGLALMFAQQQARRQEERKAEEEAEQMRRAALFSAESLAGLYS